MHSLDEVRININVGNFY